MPQHVGQRLAAISVTAEGRYGRTDKYTVGVPQLALYSVIYGKPSMQLRAHPDTRHYSPFAVCKIAFM
jgi:hypothetical protein